MKSLPATKFISLLLLLTACTQADKKMMSSTATAGQKASNDSTLKVMDMNGVGLHYVERGEGVPVIFVHPGYSDYRTWRNQMEAFSTRYRAIAYSRRYSFPNKTPIDSTSAFSKVHVNDLISFIRSLKAGPVHLVGHSAGGWIALQASLQQPELVKTLILGEPAVADFYIGEAQGELLLNEFLAGLMRTKEAYRRNEDREAARIFIGLVMGREDYLENLDEEARQIVLDNLAEAKAETLVKVPKGDALPPITCEGVQKLTIPVLLVCGAESPKFVTYMQDKLEDVW